MGSYYGDPLAGMLGLLAGVGIFFLIGLVVIIVATVLIYRRFVHHDRDEVASLRRQGGLRAFLNFDTLIIEPILKALYIFCTLFVAHLHLCMLIGLIFTARGQTFFETLFLIVGVFIGCLFGEVLLRLFYENLMLRVIIARNTTEIRHIVGENPQAPGAYRRQAAPAPVPTAPVTREVQMAPAPVPAPTPAPAPATVVQQQTAPAAPQRRRHMAPTAAKDTAPNGYTGSHMAQATQTTQTAQAAQAAQTARVCPSCGRQIEPGAHFCRHCGTAM